LSNDTSITIRLPNDKRLQLNQLALQEGIPASGIIRNMIYKKLEDAKEQKQVS